MTEGTALDRLPSAAAVESGAVIVRKALLSDVKPLLELINGYASQGIMLPRTEFELSENIRDFTVAVQGARLLGGGALHFYGPKTGEIRSLAVDPEWMNLGIGKRLMEALESEAAAHGLYSVFAFTYVPGFFGKLNFVEVARQELPSKVWKDCLRCPKLECCDEIAMQKTLAPVGETTPLCGDGTGEGAGVNGMIVLPSMVKRPSL
jgi:amino-acid N-acetyltransferase